MQAVPVVADPFPGVPVRGRGAAGRADGCRASIETALTPHGLRHGYKTLMDELGTPTKLMDANMGHANGSVQAVYSHVTAVMVQRLMDGLTEIWQASLDARLALGRQSPVGVLDRLLAERLREQGK
jgi:hypothetical protein